MKRISKVLIFSLALTALLSFNVYAKADEQYNSNGTILHYVLEDGSTAPEHWEKKNGTWYYYSENNIAFKDTVIAAYDDKYYAFDKKVDCKSKCRFAQLTSGKSRQCRENRQKR